MLLNELFPSQARVNRIIPTTAPTCLLCDTDQVDDYSHSFFDCAKNNEAAEAMLTLARVYDRNLTPAKLLRLEVNTDLVFALPTTIILAAGFSLIAANRKEGRATTRAAMKAELRATAETLTRSRRRILREAGDIVFNLIVNFLA